MSPRFRLDIEYDGSAFSGWQVQPERRTVQGTLAEALGRLGEPSMPSAAGRTDAGVHALGNVAHVDLQRSWDPMELTRALRSQSPDDLRVRAVSAAAADFHARHHAEVRGYAYAFSERDDLFYRRRRWTVRALPAPRWVAEATRGLVGRIDAAALARSGSETKSSWCYVHEVFWMSLPDGALLRIVADRFLYGMVRALTGWLIRAHAGGADPGELDRVLETRQRAAVGAAAPPQGLYLGGVGYPGNPLDGLVWGRAARVAGLDRSD